MAQGRFNAHTDINMPTLDAALPKPARVLFGLPQFTVALLALAAFAAVFAAPADFDYWWHLADGRFIATAHRLPVPDPFSFTASGRSWTAHEWLVELIMYQLHLHVGVAGVLAFFGLCMAATVLVVVRALRGMGLGWLPTTACVALMLTALLSFLGPRPYVLALLLLAVEFWLIERWSRRGDRRIWLLPLLMWLWANVNASFIIGLLVPLLMLAGDLLAAVFAAPTRARLSAPARRRLSVAVGLALVAACVTPNGPALLLFPFKALGDPMSRYITEWQPTSITAPAMWGFTLLAGGAIGLVVVRRPRLTLADMLLGGAFLVLGLARMRLVGVSAVGLVMLIGRVMTLPNTSAMPRAGLGAALMRCYQARARAHAHPSRARQLANVALLLVVVGLGASVIRPYQAERDARLPIAAVDALGSTGLAGPLLHDFNWGGYLIWRLWPDTRVFIDGRQNDLYDGADGEFRTYVQITTLEPAVDDLLDRYAIRTVLFPKAAPLTRYLAKSGQWDVTYDDGAVVRLERRP